MPNGRSGSGRESDARFWRGRWGREERAQFLIEIAQGGIMEEERVINLGETFQKGAVRSQFVAGFYECTDDIETDSRSSRTLARFPSGQCSPSNGVPARRIHLHGSSAF